MTQPSSASDPSDGDPLRLWLGKIVVLDTQGPLLYIGTLAAATERHFILHEADVHHATDSRTTKDLYLVESRDLGVRVNRASVIVERHQIASISLLETVCN